MPIFFFWLGGGGGAFWEMWKWRIRIFWMLLTEDSYLVLHVMKDVVT